MNPGRVPIRVGFVLHVMQVAGAEMLVADIIRRLGRSIDPTVLCLDAIGALGERLREEQVEVVSLDRRPGFDFRTARRLARVCRARRIEIVHAHQYTPFFYAALAKGLMRRASRSRVILTEHGRHYPDVVSPRRRLANRLFLQSCADQVTAVCDFSARSLRDNDGFTSRRIQVIENGIDLGVYAAVNKHEAKRSLGVDPQRRHVGCIARFHPVKDHDTLLRGFQRVAASRPDVDLVLVGDGERRSELQALVESLDLRSRVRMLGVRSDVPAILQALDVFALTSLSEAASITLLEAMAAGLPVVVTNVGGNPEIVRPEIDGLLTPRRDPETLATALGRILDDARLAAALGQAGADRVREVYSLERTVSRYHELYTRLADEAH